MADRDRATVDIQNFIWNTELVATIENLHRERFVEFPQVDVIHTEAATFEQSGHGKHGTDSHFVGLAARDRGAAGGVGIAAVEIAKTMGASVIAAANGADKLAFAAESGADELIDYGKESLRDAIKTLTDGNGVDVVYDPVGGELALQALRSLAWQGRYLVIGFASGDIPKMPANIALLKEASIIGVWWGTWAKKNPALQAQNVQDLGAMIEGGKLGMRVSRIFPLAEYRDAFRAISERRALGKVVLTFGDN